MKRFFEQTLYRLRQESFFYCIMVGMRVIVACSGGPDSMALLDICRKKGYEIAVAHVNYKKRETANRDEKIVRQYCENYGIPCFVDEPTWDHVGNFQAWARDVRYDFFIDCAKRFSTKQIEVAHQMDDCLETYVFQKQSGRLPGCWGIQEKMLRKGFWIERPLLGYTKAELAEYCDKARVPYGIDESNLSDDYTRNRIRHHILANYSQEDKVALMEKIRKENADLEMQREKADAFLKSDWTCSQLIKEQSPFVLERFLYQNCHQHLAMKHVASLWKQIQSDCLIDLGDYTLESFHDHLYCEKKQEAFQLFLPALEYKSYGPFSLCEKGKVIEGMNLQSGDFPLCIRTVKEGDKIALRFGTKKLSRFFVDRKIPKTWRKKWLVVENAEKVIIFVPGIGCDVQHFSTHPNAFMIQ